MGTSLGTSESESIAAPRSNRRAARSCSEKTSAARRSKFFRALAELACSGKIAFELHLLTGESERTCAYWLAGTREPPATIFMVLLGAVASKLR